MRIDERNSFQRDKFTLAILNDPEDFKCTKGFDCGNADLNEFFQKDALAHKQQLLAETYLLQPRKATEEDLIVPVAFISFLNDAVLITREERKGSKIKFWKHPISFYKKNGFDFLLEDEPGDKETRIMFFDLKRYKNGS